MDSVNLSETRTPLNCKSTASNTSPIPCACCGLKDSIYFAPQAHCFTGLYPRVSKCKLSRDNVEERLPMQQPFFPLHSPFFHNSVIPLSSHCSTSPSNDTPKREKHNSSNDCVKNHRQPNNNFFSDKEKSGFSATLEEDSQKKFCSMGPQANYLGNPLHFFNSPDFPINSFFHRCACGDSLPWACSSFIVPIVSYCFFWNSQKSNLGLDGNYSSYSTDNKKKYEYPATQKQSCGNITKEMSMQTNADNLSNNSAIPEKENCLKADSLTGIGWKNEESTREECSEDEKFLTHDSQNFGEDNNYESAAQIDENSTDLSNDNEDIHVKEEDIEGSTSEETLKDCDFMKLNKKNTSNSSMVTNSTNDPDDPDDGLFKEIDNELPSSSILMSDLKKIENDRSSDTGVLFSAQEISPSESSTEGDNFNPSEKELDDEWEGNKSEIRPTSSNEHTQSKKVINNFTLTDVVNDGRQEEPPKRQFVAAGDLGGENCVGYRVDMRTIQVEIQTQKNLQSKECFHQGLENSENNTLKEICEKNTEKKSKTKPGFKSGIAKLLSNSKVKEPRGIEEKTKQNNKVESSPKEPLVKKRKHSCFNSDNLVGPYDSNLKIQKIRNIKIVQHQAQEPIEQQKNKNIKDGPPKKEVKVSKVKVQMPCNSQKTAKSAGKK